MAPTSVRAKRVVLPPRVVSVRLHVVAKTGTTAAASKRPKSSFTRARNAKLDEFYTQLADIERELKHYKKHFKGKVVYCNCDDPRISNFFHYFSHNFEKLGLKKVIATG